MEGIDQFRPLVVDVNHLNQLRRDWELAFTLHLQNGRSSEQLQHLLHSQFSFLENIVLNLSKQCQSLQEQVVSERSINDRLVGALNDSRAETKDLVFKLVRRIDDLERFQNAFITPVNELKSEIVVLNSKIAVQQNQIKAMEDALSLQKSAIQTTMDQNADIKREETVNIFNLNNAFKSEIDAIKKMIEEEREIRKIEKNRLEETFSAADALTAKQNEKFISNTLVEIGSLKAKLEKQVSMIKQEQITVLSVIKTMSGSISNLRKEVQVHDVKQNVKIESAKQSIIQQVKSEIKSVSRPLIIS